MKSILANRRILALAVALVVLVASSVGGTIAWFTDTVSSGSNIIKSGKLDVEMYYADGSAAVPTSILDWKNASSTLIFDCDQWEPGYTEVRHIKIENKGNLAFNYKLNIITAYPVNPSILADVIDVYYIYPAQQITDRSALANLTPVGTLREMIADPDGAVHGVLLPADTAEEDANGQPVGAVTATIALKMRESAGNEYQGMALAEDITIQLFANQLAFEEDSFGSDYDSVLTEPLPQVSSAADLASYISSGESAAISGDITLSSEESSLIINSGSESTIDLAGNTLTVDSGAAVVVANGTLNLVNSSSSGEDGEAKIVISDSSLGIGATGSGVMNIGEGIAIETGSNIEGNIVAMSGGTINMTKGEIVAKGNRAVNLSDGSSFNMSGGKITVERGSAVYVYDSQSTVTMTGGEIIVNAPTTNEDGVITHINSGIYVDKSDPTISLTGGKITVKGSGAIGLNLFYSDATVTLSSPFCFDVSEGGYALKTTGSNTPTINDSNNILNDSNTL